VHKILAVITALATVLAAVLGLAAHVGMESTEKYHLATGLLALALVLVTCHRMYHRT